MLRSLVLAAAIAVMAVSAQAQSVKLKAHEIVALLTGNTAVGTWAGTPYRQFFSDDGTTIFAQEGARSALGQWRVDAERDEYQSIWPREADWEGWFVMEYAGDFYWVSKSTPPTSFKVIEGEQLVVDTKVEKSAFCKGVDRLGDTLNNAGTTPDQSFALPKHLAAQNGCKQSLNAGGGKSLHCSWTFPYRAEEATQAFGTVVGQMSECGAHTQSTDQSVNHPDFYDLRLFEFDDATTSVSLKDKGALQQTLVFLTVTRP